MSSPEQSPSFRNLPPLAEEDVHMNVTSPLPSLLPESSHYRQGRRAYPSSSFGPGLEDDDEETPPFVPPNNSCRACEVLVDSVQRLRQEKAEKEAENISLRQQLMVTRHQIDQTLEELGVFLDSFVTLERNIQSLRRCYQHIQRQLETSGNALSSLGGARLVASRLVQEGFITPADITGMESSGAEKAGTKRLSSRAAKELLAARKRKKVSLASSSSAFAPPPPVPSQTGVTTGAEEVPQTDPPAPLVPDLAATTTILPVGEAELPRERVTESAPIFSLQISDLGMLSVLRSHPDEISDDRSGAETAGDGLANQETTVPTTSEAQLARDMVIELSGVPTTDLNIPASELLGDLPMSAVGEPSILGGLDLSIGVGTDRADIPFVGARTDDPPTTTGPPTSTVPTTAVPTTGPEAPSNEELATRLKAMEDNFMNFTMNNVVGQTHVLDLASFRLGVKFLYDLLLKRGHVSTATIEADVILTSVLWAMYS